MKGLFTKFGYKKVRYEELGSNDETHLAGISQEKTTRTEAGKAADRVAHEIIFNAYPFKDDAEALNVLHEFANALTLGIREREEIGGYEAFSLPLPDNDKQYAYIRQLVARDVETDIQNGIAPEMPRVDHQTGQTVTYEKSTIPNYSIKTIIYDNGKTPTAAIVNTPPPKEN